MFRTLLLTAFLGLISISVYAQSDKDQIQAAREASNEALRNYDTEGLLSFLTKNVLITTGAGSLIHGKKELRGYINSQDGPRMFWERSPNEIDVNSERGLAWESGSWKGYTEASDQPVVGGKYSAMWTKESGEWKIKSQLFVTLE